ncbi:MAG: regulatory iron-sulfur-containing complex subunit RicT [Thermogutta sp.]|jgi:cell fate regulator YaaT (PSP1 superfamily)
MATRYIVRFGAMRLLGIFTPAREGETFVRGDRVIVRTDRGLEVGEVLIESSERTESFLTNPMRGQIVRKMTAEDEREALQIRRRAPDEIARCERIIKELGLQMELVDVEHIFGGERIIVYYLADGRVDFRELVRRLASEFRTRIEMRQIGVRDEAKLLADYGDCGKPVCCNNHLVTMPPVSMKMAKLQKATLDPAKISGRCGRLKCCLRYEFEQYEELLEKLPPVGSRVLTDEGEGEVIGHEILAQKVLVETADHVRKLISVDKIRQVISRPTEQETAAVEGPGREDSTASVE